VEYPVEHDFREASRLLAIVKRLYRYPDPRCYYAGCERHLADFHDLCNYVAMFELVSLMCQARCIGNNVSCIVNSDEDRICDAAQPKVNEHAPAASPASLALYD
jgi:hypothetical protein